MVVEIQSESRTLSQKRVALRSRSRPCSLQNAYPRFSQARLGYRWYSPRLHMLLSPDPIGERGGVNLCSFVENDPVNSVDAAGLFGLRLPRDPGLWPRLTPPRVRWPNVRISIPQPKPPSPPKPLGAIQTIKKCHVTVVVGHGLSSSRFKEDGSLKDPTDVEIPGIVPANIKVEPWAGATVVACNAGLYVKITGGGAQVPGYAMDKGGVPFAEGETEINRAFEASRTYANTLAGRKGCSCECPGGIVVSIDCKFDIYDRNVQVPEPAINACRQRIIVPCTQ